MDDESARDEVAARAALVLALVVLVAPVVGAITGIIGDHITLAKSGEDERMALLAPVFGSGAVVVVLAHLGACWAAWQLARRPLFSSSALAQPTMMFGALRVAAGVVVAAVSAVPAAGFVVPALHQPLVGFAVALVDAAFLGCLLVVAAAVVPRAAWVALAFVVYRLAASAIGFLPPEHLETASLVHRLASLAVMGAVSITLLEVATRLRRA
jgi:general stress protein CsbA